MTLLTVSVPSPACLDHHVADIVDDIGIVAGAALHRVGALAAVEDVGAALPVRMLASMLPVAVDRAGPGEGEVLDIGAEREADAAHDHVDAVGGTDLDYLVADWSTK